MRTAVWSFPFGLYPQDLPVSRGNRCLGSAGRPSTSTARRSAGLRPRCTCWPGVANCDFRVPSHALGSTGAGRLRRAAHHVTRPAPARTPAPPRRLNGRPPWGGISGSPLKSAWVASSRPTARQCCRQACSGGRAPQWGHQQSQSFANRPPQDPPERSS